MPDVTLGTFQHFAAEVRETGRAPRVYVSGPMSGLHQKNLSAFRRAQDFFKKLGFEVLNPAENERRVFDIFDAQTWAGMTTEEKWQAFMDVDEGMVRRADLVVGMEKGVFGSRKSWRESRGARIERKWALEEGKPFHALTQRSVREMAGRESRVPRKFGGKRTRALPRGVQGGHQKAAIRYWLDLETQGLRTQARSKIPGIPSRRATDRLRLSQISFGREVKPGMIDFLYGSGDIKGTEKGKHAKVFTDIISEELLSKFNVQDPNALPDEFLKHLTQQDMKGYWDVGVYIEGNPLREGLKRHVAHVLGQRQVHSERKVVEGMLDRMLEDVHRGKKVELTGWNVGFDWSRVEEVANQSKAVSRKMQQLMLHQNFRIKEAAEPVFDMTWNLMAKDRDFVPRFTDRARLEQLARQNKNLRGAIVEHSALRSFMDIVGMENPVERFSKFQERFKAHLQYGESDDLALELAEVMTKTRTYGDYRDVVRRLKGHEDRAVALRQLFDRSFKPTEGKHVSLLGIAGRDESVLTTGFNFTLGWRQEQVVEALAEIADNPTDQKMLKELIEAGLHDSDIDIMTSARISKILRDISEAGPNSRKFQDFISRTLANEDAMAAGFAEEIKAAEYLKRVLGKAQLGPEDANLSKAVHWTEKSGIKSPKMLAGAAALMGAMWLIGEHNRGDDRIEGVRRPVSDWDMIPGIDPTGVGSDFGSGRSVLSQLVGENYFSRAPQMLTKSREQLWELTQYANALKPRGANLRAVEEGAVKSRNFRQSIIDQTHLAQNELTDPWSKLAGKLDEAGGEMALDNFAPMREVGEHDSIFSAGFETNYMPGRMRDHYDLAGEATIGLRTAREQSRTNWANRYQAAQAYKPQLEHHRPIHLVNEVERRMPALTSLQAGHAGFVQNLGRMSKRSHLRDPYARLGGVNPVVAQFRRSGAASKGVRATRMEACAC